MKTKFITREEIDLYSREPKTYHFKTAIILLERIKTSTYGSKPLITYKEIGDQTGRDPQKEVPYDAAALSVMCRRDLDLPLISAIIVAAKPDLKHKRQMPGNGFYDLWKEYHPDQDYSDLEIFDLELQKIIECDRWLKLEKHLKLGKQIFTPDYTPIRKVLSAEIGKDYNFKDYDIDMRDIHLSKTKRAARTIRHQALVRKIAAELETQGFKTYEGIMDCVAVNSDGKTRLIEVKTLAEDGSDLLHQIRTALGQILYYQHFHLVQVPGMNILFHPDISIF